MKEQSYKVVQYLQKKNGSTAAEVAEALDLTKRLVDSIFSSAVVRGGLGERKTVNEKNLLILNEKGLKYEQ